MFHMKREAQTGRTMTTDLNQQWESLIETFTAGAEEAVQVGRLIINEEGIQWELAEDLEDVVIQGSSPLIDFMLRPEVWGRILLEENLLHEGKPSRPNMRGELMNALNAGLLTNGSFSLNETKGYLVNRLRALQTKIATFELHQDLLGVRLETDSFELEDGVTCYRVPKEEVSRRMFAAFHSGFPIAVASARLRVIIGNCTVEGTVNLNSGPSEVDQNRFSLVSKRVKNAFLLASPTSIVETGRSNYRMIEPSAGWCPTAWGNYHQSSAIGSPFQLNGAGQNMVKQCYELARKLEANATYKTALHRFELGCLRTRPSDQIVDFMIALESILVPTQSGEISLRFSLNGSSLSHWVAGLDREEEFKFFKDAYNLRSSLVHGSKKKTPDSAIVQQVCEQLRLRIVSFLAWLIEHGPSQGFKPGDDPSFYRLLFKGPAKRDWSPLHPFKTYKQPKAT